MAFVDHFKISTAVVSPEFEKARVEMKPNNDIERYEVTRNSFRLQETESMSPTCRFEEQSKCCTVEQSTVTAGPPGLLRSEPSGEP